MRPPSSPAAPASPQKQQLPPVPRAPARARTLFTRSGMELPHASTVAASTEGRTPRIRPITMHAPTSCPAAAFSHMMDSRKARTVKTASARPPKRPSRGYSAHTSTQPSA